MTPQAPPPGATAASIAARLRLIPDSHRTFSVSRTRAVSQYRVSDDVLDSMIEHGLPHAAGRTTRFEHYDLINVSMDLGITSVWTVGMRSWPTVLDQKAKTVAHRVHYVPTCPDPGHDDDCAFTVLTPDGRVDRARPAGLRSPLLAVTFRTDTEWPEVPEPVRTMIDEFSGLRFTRLPSSLQFDLSFIRSTGLGDCAGVAQLLEAEGLRRGLAIRAAFGLIVAPPYSSVHCWNEVRVDDTWVPIDPLLINAMARWGNLDRAAWAAHRSPGVLLGRLTGSVTAVATHAGHITEISFPTRPLAPPAGA